MGVGAERKEAVGGSEEESVGVAKGSRANVGGRRGRKLRGYGFCDKRLWVNNNCATSEASHECNERSESGVELREGFIMGVWEDGTFCARSVLC